MMVRSASARRFLIFAGCVGSLILIACSDGAPPPIQDSDGGPNTKTDAAPVLCGSPSQGCPCEDAGAKFDCGKVYRISGKHVDCSEGYLTCGTDGKWGACIGASVYDGG
jgi:hypothetical protein